MRTWPDWPARCYGRAAWRSLGAATNSGDAYGLSWTSARGGLAALLAALLILHTPAALADRDPASGAPLPPSRQKKGTPSPITDRFYLEGIFYPVTVRTGLRVDPTQGAGAGTAGTTLSGERDFGLLPRQYQARVEAMMRLRERSQVVLDYESVSRSAAPILSRTIQFGNAPLQAGEQVSTSFQWQELTLTYLYALYRSDWLEISTGAAIHLFDTEAHAEVPSTGELQDQSAAVFFPTIPIAIAWRFSRRFAVTGRAQYFKTRDGTFSGSLLDLHSDVQYRWTAHFALGIGYTLERVAGDLTGPAPGAFSLDLRGEEAFFRVSF